MDDRCAKARLIHAECRRLTRGSRRLARRADLFRRRDERVSALQTAPGQTGTADSRCFA
jgi:hypothetical protein